MKKRKIQIILLLFVLLCFGCGKHDKNNEGKNNSQNNSNSEMTKAVADPEEYVNCFDVQSIVSSLKINGEDMSFPIELSKLKQSITVNSLEQTTSAHNYRGVLSDGDTDIGVVELYSESGGTEDAFIYFIEVKEGSPWNLEVAGVSFGASVEQVENAIGEPIYKNGAEDGVYRIYYENCSYEFLAFAFDNGVLKTISFSYLPQEWRNP